jgi:phosphoglycerol transferase MdoB-like AlkP superfamily enzyme
VIVDFSLILLIIAIPLIARIWIFMLLLKTPKHHVISHWKKGEIFGLCQDVFVILVQLEILHLLSAHSKPNSQFLTLIVGIAVSSITLYHLLDALMLQIFQLRMKLSYLKYLAYAKSFLHSAMQKGVIPLVAMVVILFSYIVAACFYLVPMQQTHHEPTSIFLGIVLLIVGFVGLRSQHRSLLIDYYNSWFREFCLLFTGKFTGDNKEIKEIQKYLSSCERYDLLSEEFPLLRMTLGFSGKKTFEVRRKENETPHVIIISIESFRAKDLGFFGNPHGASPRFDSLIKEGIFFSNFHASGIPTARSLLGTLCGLYPKLHPQMLFESNPLYPLIGIPTLLKPYRYRSSYIQSGDLYFQNYGTFLESHGFDEIFGDDQITAAIPEAYGTSWGVHDEFVLRYAAQHLEKQERKEIPTFMVLLTGTNHHPWNVPEGFKVPKFQLPKDSLYRRYLNTFYYSDAVVGNFIKKLEKMGISENCIIFITSDTGQPMGEHGGNYMLFNDLYSEHEHIPLLILAKGRISTPKIIKETTSQIDIMPTIIDILGINGVNHSLGTSLQRPIPKRILFTANPHATTHVKAYRDKYHFTLNVDADHGELFDIKNDPAEITDLSQTKPRTATALKEEAKSFFSALNYLYDSQRICPQSSDSIVYDNPSILDEQLQQQILSMKNISLISITGCPQLTDEGLNNISDSVKNLQVLQLNKLLITDKTLISLEGKCSRLRSLKITYCPNITSEGIFRIVKNAPSLVEADFSGCSQVDDDVVRSLASACPNLRTLSLKGCVKIGDYPIYLLSQHCSDLRNLDLQGVINVEDDTLEILSKAKFQLRVLSLLDCPSVTDEGFTKLIKKQQSLREISCSSTYLTDQSIADITKYVMNLYKICFNDCEGFSNEAINSLILKFNGLEAIGLSHCPNLSDQFLQALEGLPLHHLFLVDFPKITDTGLNSIKMLPLRNLCIINCPGISARKMKEVRDHFKKQSTEVNILTDFDI